MKNLDLFVISSKSNIRDAIKQMDQNGQGILIIENEHGKVAGILTDGDFRRAVLNGVDFSQAVIDIANLDFTYVNESATEDELDHLFRNSVVREIPVLDGEGQLSDLVLEEDFLLQRGQRSPVRKPLPEGTEVVIMAGGLGTRLAPFTSVFPKPLVPVGEKPVIMHILERFRAHGVAKYYLSVNYKAYMLRAYFEELRSEWRDLDIRYLTESTPLGTAGSLGMLRDDKCKNILVTNCDILIDTNLRNLVDFHDEQENELTIVGAVINQTVPYGVCEIENGGQLSRLVEKPFQDYLVSTGMYVIERAALNFIPDNRKFDMTDLIDALRKNSKKIGIFPIRQEAFLDIGQWDEYKKTIRAMGLG